MSSQEKLLSRTFMLGFLVMILDTSCAGSFMKKTIEFRWDLLERIKRNSEYWDLEKVKSQVLSLSMIVLNLLWIPMLFKSLALNMDLTLR